MMRARKLSPSEIRMAELCGLRRPLTAGEQAEVMALKRRISNAACYRRRYANDAAFRAHDIARGCQRYRENRA